MNRRSEKVLLHDAAMHAAAERESQSKLLVDIAEIDARKVYREAGYDSIHSFCVQELRLSEKAAFHRIWVSRVAWKFPCVLSALADCRLHMSAVSMLATYLTDENSEELVASCANRSKSEISEWIAERFPRQNLFVATIAEPQRELMPSDSTETIEESQGLTPIQHPPEGVGGAIVDVSRATLVERFPLKVGLRRETHEKLRHAQDLLGHVVPAGDAAEVLDRALDVLIRKLEKRKYAVTDRPRRSHYRSDARRLIPADVRRAVLRRDGGRCAFIAESGKRCLSRRRLEFDHVQPLAQGGTSTVSNVRLLCRVHNQLMAEQALGREFVESRIRQARDERAARAAKKADEAKALNAQLISGLRRLGFGADESKRAVADYGGVTGAPPEVRMKAALAYLVPAQRPPAALESIPTST